MSMRARRAADAPLSRQPGGRDALLATAAERHRQGDLAGAAAGYRAVLARWPDDPDALHLSGLAAHQAGDSTAGLAAIDRAIARRPLAPSFHANRGLVLKALGRGEAAVAAFRQALALRPGHPEAAANLGNALLEAGDAAGAVEPLRAALAAAPGFLAARLTLARALLRLGEAAAAIETLEEGRRTAPADPALLTALAQALVISGRAAEAEALADEAVRLAPASADAAATRAAAFHAARRHAEAATAARAALALAPAHDDARATLAAALIELGEPAAALPLLEALIRTLPGWAPAWASLGRALSRLGDHAGAVAAHRHAIAIEPRNGGHYADLGNAAQVAGDFATATTAFQDAAALAPDAPAYRLSLSMLRLMQGDLARGWPDYAARWDCPGFAEARRPLPQPVWQGEPLQGMRLAVTGEQGIGDEIMLAGLVPELRAAGAAVVLEAHHRLVPLFARAFPDVTVVPALQPPHPALLDPSVDRHVAAGDLLPLLRGDLAQWRPWPAFLQADPAALDEARARLAALGPGLKVGISWRSGNRSNGHRRSAPLPLWEPLLRTPGAVFVSLQYGDCAAELDALREATGIAVHQDATVDALRDVDGFAALVAALDLVISIDNSTVHVAGALGVPTWALLPVSPDWRWLLHDEGPHWYRSVRLFRQEAPDGWAPVIGEAAAALAAQLEGRPAPRRAPRAPAPARPRALLLNDTSAWYHWGCTGTSTALRRGIEAQGFAVETLPINQTYAIADPPPDAPALTDRAAFERFRAANPVPLRAMAEADVVLINGEGTLHGDAPAVRGLLALAHAGARWLGKPVQIVNHSCYPPEDPEAQAFYAEVYRALDYVAVREHRSFGTVCGLGAVPELAFDCLPLFIGESGVRRAGNRPDAGAPTLLLAGSASIAGARMDLLARYLRRMRRRGFRVRVLTGAAAFPAADDRLFLERLREADPDGWSELHATDAAGWLGAIAEADLFVSGRFHHSIAAATLGTPFVTMQSNTAKIEAMLELIEHAPPVPLARPDLADALEAASLAEMAARQDPALHAARVEALRLLAAINFDGLRRLNGLRELNAGTA